MSRENVVQFHDRDRSVKLRALALFLFIGLMWFVRGIDAFLPVGFSSAGVGIVPRSSGGLEGIVITPFVHASWEHLIANTIPLAGPRAPLFLPGPAGIFFSPVSPPVLSRAGPSLFCAGHAP